MPLTGNPEHDIPTEIAHGKPRKQAVAIALSEQRRKGKDLEPVPVTPKPTFAGRGNATDPRSPREAFAGRGNATDPRGNTDAILPVDASTRTAIAAHNAGLTKSQDRRAGDAEELGPHNTYADMKVTLTKGPNAGKVYFFKRFTDDGKMMLSGENMKVIIAPKGIVARAKDEDPDLIQPVPVRPVPTPSGEHNERGWFRGAKDERRGLTYDHPQIVAIRKKIQALEDRGVPYDDPRIQKMKADIRKLEGNAKDTSALAPKAEQLTNGARVHNSKGSVGEVVAVNGDTVIVAVAGKRQEWPLAKTFAAGGAEDAELLPVAEDTTYATPPKKPVPYKPFGFTVEELRRTLAPKDPAGFAKQFGKDAVSLTQLHSMLQEAEEDLQDAKRNREPLSVTDGLEEEIVALKAAIKSASRKGKDGYAESYAAARQKAGQLKPVPVGPAPDPDTQREVERRAKDDELKPVPVTRVNPAPMPKLVPKSKQKTKDGAPPLDDKQRLANIKTTLSYLRKKYDAALQKGDRYSAQQYEKDLRNWMSEKESVERRISMAKDSELQPVVV